MTKTKEPQENKVPEKSKESRIHATLIPKSNTNYALLQELCKQSKYLWNSTLFMYRQQRHLKRYLKECNEAKIAPFLDSLDSKKNNIAFLKILHQNKFEFKTSYFSMPEYFTELEAIGQTSFKENYDKLHSDAANCTIKLLAESIKSYETLLDKYYALPENQRDKKPGTYRPGFPRYKKQDELQTFQIYAIRLDRISKTQAKVIWPERIQATITENNLPNTDLIIQVPTDLDYEVRPLTQSIKKSYIAKPCKYSIIRVVPQNNCFKVELVYNKTTDISKLENLHKINDNNYKIAQYSLSEAIAIKQGPLVSQLKNKIEKEQNQETKNKLKQELTNINQVKNKSLTRILAYTVQKNYRPTIQEIKPPQQAPKLPKYIIGENRQTFIDNALIFGGIDTGIDNFLALGILADHKKENFQKLKELNLLGVKIGAALLNGRAIKSQLSHLSYQLADAQSKLKQFKPDQHTSKRIRNIYQKRDNILDNLIKQATAAVLNHCLENHVQVLVVGSDKQWKQSTKLHRTIQEIFQLLPFKKFINYLKFRIEEQGILVYITEESYTSQTSVLDYEQPIKADGDNSRREKRGLFVAEYGAQINADINAAYQMIKKIKPNIEYNHTQIDTKGTFFSTFDKQHKNKGITKTAAIVAPVDEGTKFYYENNKIKQTKILTPKQRKFRPNYERTYILSIA